MANNSTHFLSTISSGILLPSLVLKFIAMIIGVFGNITVIIHTIFLGKEKTATSYLIGNLALADLLVCLTFYPIWITEFIQIMLNIDGDQNLFCKLSRSTSSALLLVSLATLLAITVDRYLYIVKPLKYPLIVTKLRVLAVISGIWLTACCLFIVLLVYLRKLDDRLRGSCFLNNNFIYFKNIVFGYIPLSLILILNARILIVAERQRKRILAETSVAVTTCNGQCVNKMSSTTRFFHALKAVKTFAMVFAVLAFCVLTPTVVGKVLNSSCSNSCHHMWFVVFHWELYGINSVVNTFIYGMRHIKYGKVYEHVLFNLLRCTKHIN